MVDDSPVECTVQSAIVGMAGCRMGSAAFVDSDTVSVLCPSGEVEFSVSGLRHFATGAAIVCCAALPKLVQAQGAETDKLEGADVPGMIG